MGKGIGVLLMFFLFFFLHFILLIPPGNTIIGDSGETPSNPPKGQITFSFLETFALFNPHNNI